MCARGAGNWTEECILSLNHSTPAQPSLRHEQTANFPSTTVVPGQELENSQNPAWYEDLRQVTTIPRIATHRALSIETVSWLLPSILPKIFPQVGSYL